MRLISLFCALALAACTATPDNVTATRNTTGPFVVEAPAALSPAFDDDLHTLLQSAAEGRDADLLSRIAPDVTVSFGVENGHAAFVEMWKDPGAREPWGRFLDALEIALEDGAARTAQGAIQFPHHTEILRSDADGFALGRLMDGAKIHATPSRSGAAVPLNGARTVLCATVGCKPDTGAWVSVTTFDGNTGFARANSLRPTLGQRRAVFEKSAQGWILVAFVSGD